MINSLKISVLLPTFNEAKNIEKLVESLEEILQENEIHGEIVIIDDNSPDGTGVLADALAKRFMNIRVVHRQSKLGLGSAYKAGIDVARGAAVLTMDADFSHNPRAIPEMVRMLERYDIVVGSRYISGGGIRNWNMRRRILSKGANMLARFFLGLTTRDVTSGYRLYKKSVLQIIALDKIKSSGYSFLEEILFLAHQKNFHIGEVPIIFEDRYQGKSKLTKREMVKFWWTIIRLSLRRFRSAWLCPKSQESTKFD